MIKKYFLELKKKINRSWWRGLNWINLKIVGGKGSGSYIGPWALSKDMNRSEDRQIMMKDF